MNDILYHIEQIKNDPSYINSISNPETFEIVSEVLQSGTINNEMFNKPQFKMRNISGGDNGKNATYNQHFKKFDDNTKQHNSQYKNKR